MEERGKRTTESGWHCHLGWLRPGLGVKRWLFLLALGVGALSLAIASILRALYPLPMLFYYLTGQFLPRSVRIAVFLLVGSGLLGFGLWGLNRSLLEPFVVGSVCSLPQALYEYRRRERGPKVVVIGGGHGQATLLRGLKAYTTNLTAIVTVADDGGSSGRLRRELGVLPPGDFRNCIAALADDESLVTQLFQYRFGGEASLTGHSFGNLLITAMAEITGSFESALEASSRVLAIQGRVLPSTLQAITLCADVQRADGSPMRVCGESRIPQPGSRVLRVTLEPASPLAYPQAVQAILEADLIVLGPGSLYTSLLPNLMVPQIAQALRNAAAPRVYVCNVATQVGETEGYTAGDHWAALQQHVGTDVASVMMVNTRIPAHTTLPEGVAWVRGDLSGVAVRVLREDLVDESVGWRHDSDKLARAVLRLIPDKSRRVVQLLRLLEP